MTCNSLPEDLSEMTFAHHNVLCGQDKGSVHGVVGNNKKESNSNFKWTEKIIDWRAVEENQRFGREEIRCGVMIEAVLVTASWCALLTGFTDSALKMQAGERSVYDSMALRYLKHAPSLLLQCREYARSSIRTLGRKLEMFSPVNMNRRGF